MQATRAKLNHARPRLKRTILIVGCGDVGARVLAYLKSRLSSVKARAAGRQKPELAAEHASNLPNFAYINLDLDHRSSLARAAGLANWVIYLAPPPAAGVDDSRIRNYLANCRAKRLVYVSTTGVYGAAGGAWVTETSPLAPSELRGVRRVAAEKRLKTSALPHVTILRAPGIYAADRLPLARIKSGQPALIAADDVPTNHIHADDLARLCWLALFKGKNRRAYNAADGQPMMHADYLQAVAQHYGLDSPPRLPKHAVIEALSSAQWSMLAGARRVSSTRIQAEWGLKLKHPSVVDFLASLNRAI